MARPRRVEGEKTAYERMEDAFWAMLSEMPYHEMTGKELRRRAGVSHNTFYYHFENMDDMARRMFDRLITPEVTYALLSVIPVSKAPIADLRARIPGFEMRFARIRLLAASGSPLLVGMLHDTIIAAWLATVGIDEADLTPEDRIDLTFAFGGMVALFGSDLTEDTEALASFSRREIGRGLLQKMQGLAVRGRSPVAGFV